MHHYHIHKIRKYCTCISSDLELAPEALCLQGVVSHINLLHCRVVELEPPVLVGVDGRVTLPLLTQCITILNICAPLPLRTDFVKTKKSVKTNAYQQRNTKLRLI